jgi:hypothetical protein
MDFNNLIKNLAHDIYNFTQLAKKGKVQENVPFLCHANGKAYIITAEKEKKHTFFRFLNKIKINVYETGGALDQKGRTIGSPDEAVEKGLLNPSNDKGFYTVSTEGAKLLMEFEAKKSVSKKTIQSKLRENIPEFASQSSTPDQSTTIPKGNPKPKNRPHVTFSNEPTTPTPTAKPSHSPKTQAPEIVEKPEIDLNDPFGIGYEGPQRGVLDDLKRHINENPYKKRLPPENPPQ